MTSYAVLLDYYTLPNLPGTPKFRGQLFIRGYQGYVVGIERNPRRDSALWHHTTPDGRVFDLEVMDDHWADLNHFLAMYERNLMSLMSYLDAIWDREIERYNSRKITLLPRLLEPEKGINQYVKYVHVEVADHGDYLLYVRAKTDRIIYGILDPLTEKVIYTTMDRWNELPYLIYAGYHTRFLREPIRKLVQEIKGMIR